MTDPIRIWLEEVKKQPGKYRAILAGATLCISHQPALDAARELLRLGYPPATPMTTRYIGKTFDNWVPAPISTFAKLSTRDNNRGTPTFRKFEPFLSPGKPKDAA